MPTRSTNQAIRINAKLKNLRKGLKCLSKRLSHLNVLITNSNDAIAVLDNLEEHRPLSIDELPANSKRAYSEILTL